MSGANARRVRVEVKTLIRPSPRYLFTGCALSGLHSLRSCPSGRGILFELDMRKTVAVDASFLKAFLVRPGRPASITSLLRVLSAENARVIIPTPALAEFLKLMPESAQSCLETINKSACFQVRPFDDRASIELADLLGGNVGGVRDILPFDRQIVA